MKKLLFLTAICLANINSVFAQDDLTPKEIQAYEEENQKFSEENAKYLFKDCGAAPKVSVNAVVRYTDHAEVYIELVNNSESRQKISLKSENGEEIRFSNEGNKITVENLPLDQIFYLTTSNECDENIELATIETGVNSIGSVKTSSENLFNLVNEWAKEGSSQMALPQYIFSLIVQNGFNTERE